jgi:hypothetical protein
MASLRDLFPGFKVIHVPDKGFRVQCLSGCYDARPSGWRRTAVVLPSIPEVRAWVRAHDRHTSLAEAKAECARMSAQRLADQVGIDLREDA